MWVVKLGGSLDVAGRLGEWARALACAHTPLLAVPGGGAFADGVRAAQRRWSVDDRSAHAMAVLAMEQMGHLLCALAPGLTGTKDVDAARLRAAGAGAQVWLPSRALLDGGRQDAGQIPADWDVTSDSLAAIVAARLPAKGLVLVKSAPLRGPAATAAVLQSRGVIDAAFHRFGARSGCPVWLLGNARPEALLDLLAGDDRAAVRVQFDAPAPPAGR